jgi:enterobacterial common antigen flippase
VIVIGIMRTKAMAMLLGPAGFGLMGALTAIADFARSVADLGISASGVRQIAEANSSGDAQRVARTVYVLRRVSVLLGLLGAGMVVLLALPISRLTFEDSSHVVPVALLSLAIFFKLIADAQTALMQGLRRIGDMARINVIAALLGTLASIALVYWYRVDGVAMAVVIIAACSALTAWWYTRKIKIERPQISRSAAWQETTALLRLGVAFMASSMLMLGTIYVVRIIIIREHGLEAAGHYQAAWTLGGLYIGIITQAMGADFYPRLVGAIKNHAETNRLVNEQAHVSLLLSGIGVMATITLAPLAIMLFYSPQFLAATETLRWICLGMALRVVSFPMGYVIVAKGSQLVFIGAELAWTIVNIALSWYCIQRFGLPGAGIAFFGSYLFHIAMTYAIVRSMTGFRWTAENGLICLETLGLTACVFVGFMVLNSLMATLFGLAAIALVAFLSFRKLAGLTRTSPDSPRFALMPLGTVLSRALARIAGR